MAHVPTPDEADQVFFVVRWWKEFFLGLAAYAAAIATLRKGQKMPVAVTLSEDAIQQKMEICKLEMKNEWHEELEVALRIHRQDMLKQIDLMIKAAMK